MMKRIVTTFFLCLLLICMATNFCAEALHTDFSVKSVSEAEQQRLLQVLHLRYLSKAPLFRSFEDYAVHTDGRIVTGSDVFPLKTLCIYDQNGKFQYGYTFLSEGAYDVAWSGNDVLVFTARGDTVYSLNEKGECTTVAKLEDTIANEDYRRTLQRKKKQVGQTIYEAENVSIPVIKLLFAFFPYTKITKTTDNGAKITVLRHFPIAALIAGIVTFLINAITVILLLVYHQRKRFSSKKDPQ